MNQRTSVLQHWEIAFDQLLLYQIVAIKVLNRFLLFPEHPFNPIRRIFDTKWKLFGRELCTREVCVNGILCWWKRSSQSSFQAIWISHFIRSWNCRKLFVQIKVAVSAVAQFILINQRKMLICLCLFFVESIWFESNKSKSMVMRKTRKAFGLM